MFILAGICIVLGFVVAAFDVKILFDPLAWFVAAIALNTLTVYDPRRKPASSS